VIPVITQAGLFLSPILFSSSSIYSGDYPEILKYIWSLNPMVAIVEGFKISLLGIEKLYMHPGLWVSLGSCFFLLFFGLRYFRKSEHNFSDVI
jgi:lipopolysaccharide transport system permease protein